MKTKLTLFVAVIAVALFGTGCASLDDGLVAYYPFNGNAKDESGNEFDGIVNGAKFVVDRHGAAQGCLAFIGKGDYAQINKPIYGADPTSHSITLWVNCYTQGGEIISDRHGSSCNYKYRIYYSGSVKAKNGGPSMCWTIFEERVNQKDLYYLSFPLKKWALITCTYDLETGIMANYVDGQKIDERKHFKAWSSLPNSTTIGTLFGCAKYGATQPSGGFEGLIDDVRFYNRALSAKEVKALYDLEKPKTK